MFELKYSITDEDMKKIGKSSGVKRTVLYLSAAVIGMGFGITAVVLRPDTMLFVCGILLIVMCTLLATLTLVLLFSKTTLDSIVPIGDELTVTVTHDDITVERNGETAKYMYEDMTDVRLYGAYMLVFFGKTRVLVFKNKIVSGGNSRELYEYVEKRAGRALPPDVAAPSGEENVSEEKRTDGEETAVGNDENTDPEVSGDGEEKR